MSLTSSSLPVGVLGGGPAGLATALALQARGVAVCVIERGDQELARAGEHLGAEAGPILERLGAADLCKSARSCRGIMSAWGEPTPQIHDLGLFNPLGGGHLLERPSFDRSLCQLARERGVEYLDRHHFVEASYQRETARWQTALRTAGGGVQRDFSFLVDASGRAARLARSQGAKIVAHDRLVAVTAKSQGVAGEHLGAADDWLRIWSTEHGWWYLAMLPDGSCIATWLTEADTLGKVALPEKWAQHCNRHFGAADDRLELPSELRLTTWQRPKVWLANSQYLARVYGAGWVAVGDAAMAYDPLSSAGIAKALRGGERVAQAVTGELSGEQGALPEYAQTLEEELRQYLELRSHYYRLETRWPGAEFWKRRQHEPAHCRKLSLDPHQALQLAAQALPEAASIALAYKLPEVDGAALFRLLKARQVAYRLVNTVTASLGLDDHTAIVAIEILIEQGLLVQCDRPSKI